MNDPIEQIRLLAIETFGSKFKKYYDGDPEVLPSFNLPCLIVTQTKDDTTEAEQSEDDVTDSIRIKVVYDKRDDFTGSRDEAIDLTEKKLRDVVRALDENGQYAKGTIKRMLRDALLDGVTAVAPSMSVEFGINERPTFSEEDVPLTAEAWVTFAVQYSVVTYQ